MQDSNNWTSSSAQESSYGHHSYPYATNYVPTSTGNAPSSSTLMSLSQPNTPRPESTLPIAQDEPTDDDDTAHKPRSAGRASSFSSTSFQSTPYPTSLTRRRRTESSMFAFETGPSFTQTKQLLDVWNMDQTNGHQLQLHVKMDRGFFRAEQDWTCYRRNYFQVSATFDVHGISYLVQGSEVPCLVQSEQRQLYQVDYFSIGVSACVSGSDKKIDLIQHTPKRDKGPQMIPQPRALRSGGNLHLAPVGSNHNIVTFERMQFKTATANNGKRRAAQQYYEIIVDLFANTSNGLSLRVATCTSAPLVVRGRSPGHYADFHSRYRGVDPSSVNGDAAAAAAAAAAAGVVVVGGGGPGHPAISGHYGPPPGLGPLPPHPHAPGMDDRYHQGPSRFMSLPTSPTQDFGPYQAYAPSFYPPIMPPPSTTVGSSSARPGYPESDYAMSSSPYAHTQPPQSQGYYPPSQTTPLTSPTDESYAAANRQPVVYGDQVFKPSTLSPPNMKSSAANQPSTPQSHPSYYADQYHHHHHQHNHPPSSASASPYVDSSSSYSSFADSSNSAPVGTNAPTKLQPSPYASSTMDKPSSVDAGRPTE
ncbi:hypothetical protein [Absidia glauca]|uniref:NDT80 domain-containing protein n=1 Tax=Absidia glauca TaxID=4829 RepID=A0A168MC27_ABSGL|nr:hypothetical protein [Absidia glauca]